MTKTNEKVVLYDGSCDVCTIAKDAVETRDKNSSFRLVDTHSEEGTRIARERGLDTEKSAYVIDGEDVKDKSDMALHVLENLGWVERLVAKIGRLFPRSFSDKIYTFVSTHRKIFNRKRK